MNDDVDMSDVEWTPVVKCAGCARVLLRERRKPIGLIPAPHPYAGMEGEAVERQVRPYAALVINRKRSVDYDPRSPSDDVRLANGTVVQITKRPAVCSRQCLDALDASWRFSSGTPGDEITAELHPATTKIGDNLLSWILGSSQTLLATPSDEWIDPVERQRARSKANA